MRPTTPRVRLQNTLRGWRRPARSAALGLAVLGIAACERTELGGLVPPINDGGATQADAAAQSDALAIKPREKPSGTLCTEDGVGVEIGDRPLTRTQYINSLRDLFVATMGDDAAAQRMAALAEAIKKVPEDAYPTSTSIGFRREVKDLDAAAIAARIGVAEQAALAFTDDGDAVTLLGPCAQTANSIGSVAKCFRQFVGRFAERAYRRPLDDGELDALASKHAPVDRFIGDAIRNVVATVLGNREFYYRVVRSTETVPGQPGVFELSTFELAARLSYHLTDAPPDEPLRQAARDRSLRNPAVYAQHVDRLLNSDGGRRMLEGFFYDYLGLSRVPDPAKITDPRFVALAGTERPTAEFRDHVLTEAIDMGVISVRKGVTLAELVSVGQSYARTPDLAAIYGAPVWDGVSEPPMLTNRPGIFSHAWFNLADGVQSRPVRRGYKIRSQLLCEAIPPIPGPLEPPTIAAGLTGRENIDAIYRAGGPTCLACHSLTAPLGYPFETYDVLGRFRTEETVYDGNGQPAGKKPVDASSVPQVIADDLRPVNGPAELVARLIESGKLSSCFATRIYQFAFGRPAADPKKSCAIEQLTDHAEHFTLRDTFAASARLAEFMRFRR